MGLVWQRGTRLGGLTYVNENTVGWDEGGVVLEEEGGGDLWSGGGMLVMTEEEGLGGNVHFSHDVGSFFGFLAFYFAFVLVLLQSCIALSDYSLCLRRGQ